MPNKNARTLSLLLGEKGADTAPAPPPCRFFAAGLCPRLLLADTSFSLGVCRYSHSRKSTAPPTLQMKEALLQHIAEVLSQVCTKPAPVHPRVEEYFALKQKLVIYQVNKKEAQVQDTAEKLLSLARTNEKESVPCLPCEVCPGHLPWNQQKKQAHLQSKGHVGYVLMREAKRKIFYELLRVCV
ncbi:hypothetical protein NECID01_1852 [Nematocida sp. AWRm77]|nr:hypothetical protein NECID01_1852 [Nematocida sp. AWRm77]